MVTSLWQQTTKGTDQNRKSEKIGSKASITSHLSSLYLYMEMRRGIIKLQIQDHTED